VNVDKDKWKLEALQGATAVSSMKMLIFPDSPRIPCTPRGEWYLMFSPPDGVIQRRSKMVNPRLKVLHGFGFKRWKLPVLKKNLARNLLQVHGSYASTEGVGNL